MTLSADAAGLRARSRPATSATSPKSTERLMIASSQGKSGPHKPLSKRQRVALSLDIRVAEHTDQSDAYSATAEAARQVRPNRARTIRLLSLVVSDIAEAELVGGSGRPGSLVSARSQTRRRGAATAHAQGYARPEEGSRARPRGPARPLWAAGRGARRRDPGEAGRPQPCCWRPGTFAASAV